MPEKNEINTGNDQQVVEVPEPLLEFDNLLDSTAQRELREFYSALESSRDCDTVLVGYTPPRD